MGGVTCPGAFQWIKSYLINCRQCISTNGTLSEELLLTSGVPQGFVFGPILFLIYTLPLGDALATHKLKYQLYADDNQNWIWFRVEKLDDNIPLIVSCLKDIRHFLLTNLLKNNGDKKEFSAHGTPQQLAKLPEVSIEFDDIVFIPKYIVKDLGVTLDASLNLKEHVSQVCRRAYFELHNINCVRGSLNKVAASATIHAFVTSRLDYCNSLLSGLPKCTTRQLQKVLNSAARTLVKAKWSGHITPIL